MSASGPSGPLVVQTYTSIRDQTFSSGKSLTFLPVIKWQLIDLPALLVYTFVLKQYETKLFQ